MPKRIQRKRVRGWRMPENAVSVTRPGKWGNPFRVGDPGIETAAQAVALYEQWLHERVTHLHYDLLRDKDLACYCALDQPCHADVLLRLANK